MTAIKDAVGTVFNWSTWENLSKKSQETIIPATLLSSVCMVSLSVLLGQPVTMDMAALSAVVGCTLVAIKSLCQHWGRSEPSQTFFKQILTHLRAQSFVYGVVIGVCSITALIAVSNAKINCVEPIKMPCANPTQIASACCYEMDLIRKRISEGSIILKDVPCP